jgi:predicted amidohydrolase YtcJ
MRYAGGMADAVYYNARVLTLDARRPAAEALAVRGERLLGVGTNAAMAGLAGPQTRRIDLRGHGVLPGFHDAHLHLLALGRSRFTLDLRTVASPAELQARLADAAHRLPPHAWIIGSGWDQTTWPGRRLPERADLDRCCAGHPAYLERVDLHAALVNSAALRAAGLDRESRPPAGGELVRDAAGELTGLLLEDARALVRSRIPPPAPGDLRAALSLALREAAAHGITSVQDYSGWEAFLELERLQADGQLPVRVCEWLDFRQPLDVLREQRAHAAGGGPSLRTGMLKAFLDGSLGSRTAALLAPYHDAPQTAGALQYDQEELARLAIARAQAGFQLGFHAIGDRAASQALAVFAAAAAAVPPMPPPRLEHLQLVAPHDWPRLQQLRVIASVQPSHLLDDRRWAEERLGPQRLASAYLWRTWLRLGLPLAFGSDAPVAGLHPGLGMFAAVARPAANGYGQFPPPGEAVSLADALHAYTKGGARAEGTGHEKGSLAPGKLADFVVWSHDWRELPPHEFGANRALLTVMGGRAVYRSPDWDQ